MLFISGIGPGEWGVGRLMSALQAQAKSASDTHIVFRHEKRVALRSAFRERRFVELGREMLQRFWTWQRWQRLIKRYGMSDRESVVLIHPQTLGFEWSTEFISQRQSPTWLYLMDGSFFCVRSYNHVTGEDRACLRCVEGHWHEREKLDCVPFPVPNPAAISFVDQLKLWAETGKVRFLTQNDGQTTLARKHFGPDATIVKVGLWTHDFLGIDTGHVEKPTGPYDVVFHGNPLSAKGLLWTLQLARLCPDLNFLIPSPEEVVRHASNDVWQPLPNCNFRPMSWETGLAEEIRRSKIVLVPSLWSAPIEGALIKSIAWGRVAVVDEPTAYSAELPAQLVLRLPRQLEEAQRTLREAIQKNWSAPESLRTTWLAAFVAENRNLAARIANVCKGDTRRQTELPITQT